MMPLPLLIMELLLLTAVQASVSPATVCNKKKAKLTCPEDEVIKLQRVQVGRPDLDDPAWGGCPQSRSKKECPVQDIPDEKLEELKESCNGQNQCVFKVKNKHLGERCDKKPKISIIHWKCVGVRLILPVLDLNLTDTSPELVDPGQGYQPYQGFVAGLLDHGALVSSQNLFPDKIYRVNQAGKVMHTYILPTLSPVQGLLVYEGSAYVLPWNGQLIRLKLEDLSFQENFTLEYGLSFGSFLNDGRFFACNNGKSECSAWDLNTITKEVKIQNISRPMQAVQATFNSSTRLVVASSSGSLQVFNDQFQYLFQAGVRDNGTEGELSLPHSVQVLNEGEIVVADYLKRGQLFEYSWDGEFVRQLTLGPARWVVLWSISFQHPSVWAAGGDKHGKLEIKRFRLYQ